MSGLENNSISEMAEYCTLCGKYIDLHSLEEVYGLENGTSEETDLVCDLCVNEKLNFGDPIGGCLYGEEEADYDLQKFEILDTLSGETPIVPQRERNPIICEDHLEEITEKSKDRSLSVEEALSS